MVDPHDDTVIPPLWLRAAKSPASRIEMLVVMAAALIVPAGWIGWCGSEAGHREAVSRTPCARFRSPRCCGPVSWWALAVLALYRPSASLPQIVVAPWLCLQLAAIPVAAGIYGIAEGWLAVDGSDRWWPLTLPKRSITAEEASTILGDFNTSASIRLTPRLNGAAHERYSTRADVGARMLG